MSERFEPTATETTDAFWDATREGTYLVQWCDACGVPIHYPREVCPSCLSADSLGWRRSSGRGVVYAVSVQHRPAHPGMADQVPYAVALIDLDAGDEAVVRVMSNVVEVDPTTVRVGDPVVLSWEPMSDGRKLPLFVPAEPGEPEVRRA